MNGRAECLARDGADPLAPLRDQFALEHVDERGIIYLDGNSLGVLPERPRRESEGRGDRVGRRADHELEHW